MPAARLAAPVSAEDHARGQAASGREIVIYGDFQCTATAAAAEALATVRAAQGDRLLWVFRHFPREEAHSHAWLAAEAAEAAAAQGAFWPMHDRLLDRGEAPELDSLVETARGLGLDAKRFEAELRSGEHRPRIQRDLDSGRAALVSETPGIFIGAAAYDGPADAASLTAALEAAAAPARPGR